MEDTTPPLDLHAIQSRIKQLTETRSNCYDDTISIASDEDDFLSECVPQLQDLAYRCDHVEHFMSRQRETYMRDVACHTLVDIDDVKIRCYQGKSQALIQLACFDLRDDQMSQTKSHAICYDLLGYQGEINEIVERCLDVGSLKPEDFDTYLETLKGEICSIETENATVSVEVGNLEKGYMEDYIRLQSSIEGLNSSLEFTKSQGLGTKRADAQECSLLAEHQPESVGTHGECKLKILKVSSQIEKNKRTLKSLEDLDYIFRRCEGVIKIENILTGLEVIEYEGNQISLSLRTYIPEPEVSEQNHDLAIELLDGTLEIKNAEIFPNDVYIGEIIDAAKSFSCHFSLFPMPENKNSLEWFVRRVQYRIVVSTLRKSLVKAASKSRHSIEYIERDEMIVAHMVDGIDAFIKVSQGWPMSGSPLKLLSLKGSSQSSKEVTFSFLCRVEEMVNSLDVQVCQNLSTFMDAIEEFLKERMHVKLQSNSVKEK